MRLPLVASFAVVLGALPTWASEAKPCAPEPTDQVIAYGDVLTGTDCVISPIADRDFYNFNAGLNETVRVVATPWRYYPYNQALCWDIYDPTPALVKSECSGAALVFEAPLPKPGTYRIILYESGNDQTLSYNLSLTRVFPFPSDAAALQYSQVLSDVVDPAADVDTFVFGGTKDATISLVATPFRYYPYNQALCIELYDPGWAPVNDTTGNPVAVCSGDSIAKDIKLLKTGNYSLVVTESGHDQTLSYNLGLHCQFGTCDPKLPVCEVEATYNAGALDLVFTLRSVPLAKWDLWLNVQSTMKQIIKSKQIRIPGQRTFTAKIPSFPPSGRIGLINTLSRDNKGITCSDLTMVNTGDPVGASSANVGENVIVNVPLPPEP